MLSDLLFLSGITAHGYHNVNYFDGPKLQEHSNYFYSKALQVVDVKVLSFASPASVTGWSSQVLLSGFANVAPVSQGLGHIQYYSILNIFIKTIYNIL